jgi:hypothetical protein
MTPPILPRFPKRVLRPEWIGSFRWGFLHSFPQWQSRARRAVRGGSKQMSESIGNGLSWVRTESKIWSTIFFYHAFNQLLDALYECFQCLQCLNPDNSIAEWNKNAMQINICSDIQRVPEATDPSGSMITFQCRQASMRRKG